MTDPKILFILKKRITSGGAISRELKSSGLLNSATFVSNMLNSRGIPSVVEQAIDNNCIDRLVSTHKPSTVIIEALWVVPEKMDVLIKLHPSVRWIIRVHSEIPFLSGEGIAMGWITEYIKRNNIFISFNDFNTHIAFMDYLGKINSSNINKLIYLPNYYKVTADKISFSEYKESGCINVGCFGAIRPFKNQLLQAFAAVKFAEENNLKCKFHINSGRVEKGGEVLKNLRAFFDAFDNSHLLVEHDWLDRDDFLTLIKTMDIGLQVSLSETFNIVAADFIECGIPIVTSNKVEWMNSIFMANEFDIRDIVKKIDRAFFVSKYVSFIDWWTPGLRTFTTKSEKIWINNILR